MLLPDPFGPTRLVIPGSITRSTLFGRRERDGVQGRAGSKNSGVGMTESTLIRTISSIKEFMKHALAAPGVASRGEQRRA